MDRLSLWQSCGEGKKKNCLKHWEFKEGGVCSQIYRRQIDITTYQLLFFLSDTSLCLFGDDMEGA